MMSVHMAAAVVMAVEVIMQIIARMIGAGGLEARAQAGGEDEAGVLAEKETEVQLGKAVLRGGQKLSNGIEKRNRPNLVTRILIMSIMMTITVMQMHRTMNNTMMIPISGRNAYQMMEVTTTDRSGIFWFVLLSLDLLVDVSK